MPQNKIQIKLTTILLLIIILISQFFLISLAKTEVYFSLYDNPQKEIIKNINQAEAFINIAMYIFTDREIALPLIKALPLLTGSYNWTFSANNRNDENLMVVDDPEIIARYQHQFEKLWFEKFNLERTKKLYQIAKVNFPFMSTVSLKLEVQKININTASQYEFIKILKISESLAIKIITLRDSLSGGFKESKDLLQLLEITNLDWREWSEEGININVI